ncbi:S8 family serine peptidase [Spirillospora sp. NPDC047279]|uniref:S8 family serine peptidase n=1 Tax=Spirillospora sp. NPDC047279 TaxID=3155478 RepID=UPI0033F270EB
MNDVANLWAGAASVANGGYAWAKAIHYATDHGVKVINMSLGSESFQSCPSYLQEAVSYAVSRDVVVASAGNEGRARDWRSMPANCPGVLAAGGLDGLVKPWSGTTPGEYVTAAAPAVHVPSIDNSGVFRKPGLVGTSAATALTSGVVALVSSRYPEMPTREIVQRILATIQGRRKTRLGRRHRLRPGPPLQNPGGQSPHHSPQPRLHQTRSIGCLLLARRKRA